MDYFVSALTTHQGLQKDLSPKKILSPLLCSGVKRYKYPVFISKDASFADFHKILPEYKKVFIIYDQIVFEKYPEFFRKIKGQVYSYPVKAKEKNKSFKNLQYLCEEIISKKFSAGEDLILVIGGGLVLNLGGLAASLVARGIRYVFVPTTFTAQIDVCIGSKVAVNFFEAKNMVGVYNDPEVCYINQNFLSEISDTEFNSQLVEGLKLCLAVDKDLFLEIHQDIAIKQSKDYLVDKYLVRLVMLKMNILETDLKEENIGLSMLYGHALGHAMEVLSKYKFNHGTSVGLGMLVAAKISLLLGVCNRRLIDVHYEILKNLNLPTKIPSTIKIDEMIQKLNFNKKNYRGKCQFVLLSDIGSLAKSNQNYYHNVPKSIIIKALQSCY